MSRQRDARRWTAGAVPESGGVADAGATKKTERSRDSSIPSEKILVVEDSPIVRQLTSLALGSGGYAITTAEDGRQVFRPAERELPDLVVSDLDMPEMDGLTLLSHIRERWPGLPVIIFSNHASPEYQQRPERLGPANTS